MIELLSPAGSPEAVIAAVQSGANAIYLGAGDYNARRNAKNFSLDNLKEAVSYCHVRGVRVFLTMNTLLRDRELPGAAELASVSSDIGIDAILVQDLGTAKMLAEVCPGVEIHASTQMTVHSLEGVKRCADLGMTRVVLSRELSRDAIEHICAHSPVEIEVFVHGALCMCYSGQCFFSAVIGSRSGNRGLCAQPCRLKYGLNGKADSYPLSLKDMSLAEHLGELQDMGVSCLKLEGRMKRPEYVALVTEVYSRALREKRDPSPQEIEQLRMAFSRQGFTDGYFMGNTGAHMFGVREDSEVPKELFRTARNRYENTEAPLVPVRFEISVKDNKATTLSVSDFDGRIAESIGAVPEQARTRELTPESLSERLSKTGGTPYYCTKVSAEVAPGLSLPVSAINAMRRDALEKLSALRAEPEPHPVYPFTPTKRENGINTKPVLTVSLRRAEQLSGEMLSLNPALLYLPVDELFAKPDSIHMAEEYGVPVCAVLPRICWDKERGGLVKKLEKLRSLGVDEALIGTLDLLETAQSLGFSVRGDFGLGLTNSETAHKLKEFGLISAAASFELMLAQIRDLSKPVPTEIIAYGRLPLMITENCVIKNQSGKCSCTGSEALTDRQGEQFPVLHAPGGRCEIFNAKTLYLADRLDKLKGLGLWALRLDFTTESAKACEKILREYTSGGNFNSNEHTRGLYFRGVE